MKVTKVINETDRRENMDSIMERVQAASSLRSKRSYEKLSENALSAPFNANEGDLKAKGKLFKKLTEQALNNAVKRRKAGRVGRVMREMVVEEGLVGIPAPDSLRETLSDLGRTNSVDVRIFPESGGVCVVGAWLPEEKGNGKIYPYSIQETTCESKTFVFDDSGQIYRFECNTIEEAQRQFDESVPMDERFGDPEIKVEITRENGRLETPFRVLADRNDETSQIGVYESARRAFNKLVEAAAEGKPASIRSKEDVELLFAKDELADGEFKPVKGAKTELTAEMFQIARIKNVKALIGLDNDKELPSGHIGFTGAEKVEENALLQIGENFGRVVDSSRSVAFLEMVNPHRVSPNDKKKAIKIDLKQFSDFKDKPSIM